MASAEIVRTLRSSEESVALAAQLRRLARVATVVALLTSPAAYFWFHHEVGLSVGASLAATFGAVICFRGLVDLVIRRLIPWPSLFGTEESRLREEDVVNRRRAWTWRFIFRVGIWLASIITIVRRVAQRAADIDVGKILIAEKFSSYDAAAYSRASTLGPAPR